MALSEALILMVGLHDGKVGVEIPALLLGIGNKIHHFIGYLFKIIIPVVLKCIGCCLKPLVYVAVLEHPSVVLSLGSSGSDLEVLDGMALFTGD